jgi:hypothetical protein
MHMFDLQSVHDARTPSVPSDLSQSLRHSYDLPQELEAHKASRTPFIRRDDKNLIHVSTYMHSTTNHGPCDIPQSQGTLCLSNDKEQEAHKAPSPRHDSLIRDAYVLNETLGEFEPVEPFRLLERLPGIKNMTRVAYKATGQSTSL